jgi:hypothetical protein
MVGGGEMKDFKKLYGLNVPRARFESLKKIADVLARESFTNIPIKQAREMAVTLSLEVMNRAIRRYKQSSSAYQDIERRKDK